DARFGPPPKTLNLPPGSSVDWSRALVVVGFSDLRGAKSDVAGSFTGPAGKSELTFAPASGLALGSPGGGAPAPNGAAMAAMRAAGQAPSSDYGLVAAPAAAVLASPSGGDFAMALTFTGAQRLSVLPFAKSTQVRISGDWPAPSFDGGFLPDHPQLGAHGFAADWTVPFIGRGLSEAGESGNLSLNALGAKDLGVSFVPANNPYQNVQRALKYAVMFVGLVFLTFFVFESLSGRRLHAAQYVLIGLAQMVFYLLLLSLAEYVGFDLAFAGAATATVGLIGLYAGAAFRSRTTGALALGIFTLLYGLIYLLMRLQDFALLAGSLASFAGLAAAMFLTRNLDWYGGKAEKPPAAAASA
ncbi:MAG TPA: cell envelope integrity protein CreD, partial [Caulobacteraceae bacterium]